MEMMEYSKVESDEESEPEAEAEAEAESEAEAEAKTNTRRTRIYTQNERRKANNNKKQKPPAKIEMVEAITEYLKHRGERMTNLKKASLETLNNLILKYEIDIYEFKEERLNRLKEEKERKEREKKIYKEKLLKEEIEYKKEEELYKAIKETLTEDEHDELREKYINEARKEEEDYFNNNQLKIKQAEQKRRKIGLDLIERMGGGELSEDETYITINGLNVMIDCIGTFKKKTDDHLSELYNRNEKIILLELFEDNKYNLKNRVSTKHLFTVIKKKKSGCLM
jgi:hypothetical protein